MIININWETFHLKYYKINTVFVKEHSNYFEFFTQDGVFEIRSVYEKSENQEENVMFIERYMTDKDNLIKVETFETEKTDENVETEKEVEEDFAQIIEE